LSNSEEGGGEETGMHMFLTVLLIVQLLPKFFIPLEVAIILGFQMWNCV
jgi:hypothetical protein